MPTDQPFLEVAWTYLDHFTMTWTHSGTDVYGFHMRVWKTGTSTYVVSNQVNNPALRTYLIPPGGPSLEDNTSYSAQVTALSLSGHVASRVATIVNGTQVSQTFVDGPIYLWPEHDSAIIDFGGGDQRFLPSMDVAHLADYTLPADFLPADAIPLAVTGGVRFGCFAVASVTSPDVRTQTLPQLYGRPPGYSVPWETTPDLPITGTITGHHAGSEWLGGAPFVNAYKTIDPIQTEFNGQEAYPSVIDPQTSAPWTRATLLSYRWGWAWYAWSNYDLQADLVPPVPSAFRREVVGDGRLSLFKVYVDYAFPPTYDDEPPGPDPGPDPGPIPPGVAPSYHLDERIIRRLRRAPHVAQENVRVFYRKIELDLERGVGLPSGQGSDPLVMLRLSRDGGHTWSEPLTMSAGKIGVYTQRVIARRLGAARDTVFEVTVSDPVAWSLVNAWLDLEAGTS